ncbi:MAG: hypothetical protein KAJ07_00125 [Planctomycetes bacterium]|nr:hypothetical protein [Planctomycetota bacterium]
MSKRIFILMSVILCSINIYGGQVAVSWNAGFGGWDQSSNWTPTIVPDNNDGSGDTYAVTIDSGTGEVGVNVESHTMVDSIDVYGDETSIDSWSSDWVQLTVINGITNHGFMEVEGRDAFEIIADITNTTDNEIDLYEIEIDGDITNAVGGEITIDRVELEGILYNPTGGMVQVESYNDADEVRNAGSMVVIWNSDIWTEGAFVNNGNIELRNGVCVSDDTFSNESGSGVGGSGGVVAEVSLSNDGVIKASNGTLVLYSGGELSNDGKLENSALCSLFVNAAADINNAGEIVVNAEGGVGFNGNLINNPAGIIRMYDGTLSAVEIRQQSGASLEGFGAISGDLVIEDGAVVSLTGSTNIIGDVTIGAGASLAVSDGTVLITGAVVNNGTIAMTGGRVICQGGLTNNGSVTWEAGSDSNAADYNLDGNVNLTDFANFAESWMWQASWY